MKERLLYYWSRFSALMKRVGERVQYYVVIALLFFVYLFGIGLTKLVAALFYRQHLTLYSRSGGKESYWKEASGYESDVERLLKQV